MMFSDFLLHQRMLMMGGYICRYGRPSHADALGDVFSMSDLSLLVGYLDELQALMVVCSLWRGNGSCPRSYCNGFLLLSHL